MKRLTLVRHAKSSWKDTGLPDRDRPLSGRGKREAPEMGRRLAAGGLSPDALVTSPAKRARSTAKRIARELDFPRKGIREEEALYEASLHDLLVVVRGFDDAWDHVLLVGHNPGLSDLANYFLGRSLGDLPTAAAVCLDFDAETWSEVAEAPEGSGKLVFFDHPGNEAAG